MWKRIWKDPVWASVISAGILAVVGALGTYLLGLWPAISDVVSYPWKTAGEQSKWSNWQVWAAVTLAIPTVLLTFAALWSTARPSHRATDWRQEYLEDQFVGLRWRWTNYPDGNLGDIYSFCPHCDFQIIPHNASAYKAVDRIGFHCDSCGRDLATFAEPYHHLESRIRRLIQQKIRAGTWRRKG